MAGVLLLQALAWTATACSSGSADHGTSSSSATRDGATGPEVLPLGKSDLELEPGRYRSPEGFEPGIGLAVPEGWSSVHRGSDGFDLGKPDPERDAPEIAVVFLVPSQATAADALSKVTSRGRGWSDLRPTSLGDLPATSAELVGGRGQVVASRGGGIALDAAAGQRIRVYAVDVSGAPLLVVVLVPEGQRWRTVLPEAEALLATVRAV